jgi:proliferating cell nuclear antigen
LQLDSEQLGIPDTEYSSVVTLSSGDFSRICKELSNLAESMTIETSKDNVKFAIAGDNGKGSISLNARESEKTEEQVLLDVDEPVCLSFALRCSFHLDI